VEAELPLTHTKTLSKDLDLYLEPVRQYTVNCVVYGLYITLNYYAQKPLIMINLRQPGNCAVNTTYNRPE